MTASRLQHVTSSAIILIIAVVVAWISFTQQPADAFLFPRLISVFFAGLSAWNFIRAISGLAKVGEGLDMARFQNMLPGFLAIVIFTFFAAKALGFYFASTIAFLAIYTLYDPRFANQRKRLAQARSCHGWIMAVMYGLFALLLKVQTPKGIWF